MAGPTTAGRRLGRYHLGDPLGGGPCGSVYRAKVYGVAGFERQFAVKRFHPELVAIPIVSQRLSQAARAYGSLEHPRIARLHEYGIAAGEVFTATEMVAGLDVMRLIAATHGAGMPLPPGAALALVTQAARAVGYAHGRGVNHLGLCPTNVIVTPDGDVKITDVGVFAQTLTCRPSDDERLSVRIHYLAPEQMINEATSAATDVFAIGTLIHELVTGERAFVGVTTLDVEHAILSGHVRDAGLPKPMARVLARCFARSPFERFPDARALADAIDAALRVSPVVGGRRELGQIVKEAVARLDAMNDGQLSGAMVLAMPMAPSPAQTPKGSVGASSEVVTAIHVRPQGLGGETMRGPAPVAPAVAPLGAGEGRRRQHVPTQPPPITPPAVVPQARTTRIGHAVPPPVPPIPGARIDEESDERTLQRDPSAPKLSPAMGTIPGLPSRLPNASPLPFNTPPPEPIEVEPINDLPPPENERRSNLRLDSAWPTGEHMAIPDGAEPLAEGLRPSEPLIEMIPDEPSEGVPVEPVVIAAPPPPPPPLPAATLRVESVPAPRRRSSGTIWTVVFLVLCAGVGIGGVLVWHTWLRDRGQASAAKPPDPAEPDHVDVQTVIPDAAVEEKVAIEPARAPDAAAAAPAPDAGAPVAPTGGPLVIDSDPPGGIVYVDGAELGKAPVKVGTAGDSHSIAVFLPGHELHLAEVTGGGTQVAKLTKATLPPDGNGGIKVLCKEKKRYYIFVDGKGTGLLCPNERLNVKLGTYSVEIYDLLTEGRKSYEAKVTGTGASRRIRVD